jgi:Family of unknown function (DUF6445)
VQAHSTPSWLDAQGRFFNPAARAQVVAIGPNRPCVVVDDALANPEGVRAWSAAQPFRPPAGYPYPGLVCDVPAEMNARLADFFSQHVRAHLGVRRALELSVRLSVIDTPAEQLAPVQWMCHRDRLADERGDLLFAACVLYLFHDAGLGGTAFYEPRQSIAATDQLVADSQQLSAHDFGARYGLQPSYMADSNAYFERTARVPAAWNRLIFYDGSAFHSAEVDPARLSSDPLQGRLTLNSFITCKRSSR